MVLFITLSSLLFCPFDILYFSARKWLGVALGRIVLSYCFPVEFRDFFIADELNSLAYSFWTSSYFFCAYSWHWIGLATHCSLTTSWLTPFLASLPPWWRLLQCFRRYKDSNEKVHLVNGAKYMSSILATMINGMRRIHGTPLTFWVWVIVSLINSCYTSTWDIKMDWGLLQRNSQYRFLRDELVFHRWAYYFAIPINILLRFSWTLSFAHFKMNGEILAFMIAFLEGVRRIQWNVFRLENEHLNNCGQYRAIKEIPLPFAMMEDHEPYKLNQQEHDIVHIEDEEQQQQPEESVTRPLSIPSSRLSYHDGSFYGKRDFENKHEREDTDFLRTSSLSRRDSYHLSAPPLLNRIRSLGDPSGDVSDTDHDEDDDYDSDDNDNYVDIS
ncbi:EXS family-domain-containing protein [Chlamydoabsidia padenii]|nr:EXS family-domain-containing protein [Chlamydoabsidia padenii]